MCCLYLDSFLCCICSLSTKEGERYFLNIHYFIRGNNNALFRYVDFVDMNMSTWSVDSFVHDL